MAVENLITEHIDIWTSAVKTRSTSGRGSSKKLELYGIKKLRKLILELAVHGKLVPQDPNDEPADILVQRIMAKKKELLADGTLKKTKKSKVHDAIISAEELPLGWVAADFGDITFNLDAQRIPLSVSERKGRQGIYDYYGASGVIDSIDAYLFDKPLLLIGEDGANLVNRSTPIAFMARGKYWVNNHAHVIDGISEDFLIYLSLYINSISLIPYITGMAQPKMNQAKMNSILVLLPPEKEQHRIVAKVDELMALCDQLEQQTEASIEAHQMLVTTLLDTLTNSANADELMKNWARISEHFDTLFTTEESIDQLKQTILQLAVMGKLVPQNPSDEPAAELLKRIAEEKAQLVKDKKIKKQKALPPISEDEKPFELPSGWEWERIGTFGIVGTGATPSRSNPKYWDDPKYNWVSSGETSELFVNTTKEKVSELAIQETNVSIYPSGTLIVAMYGQGKTRGQITELTEPAGTNQACAAIQLIEKNESHKDFVKLYFRKSYEELRSNAAGGAQPNLNVGKVQSTVIAVPPLNEQRRINTKVNELLTVCDHLKAHFETVQSTQLHLTDAIVEQAV
ncbi:restriction endonuclease subunit S [Vibrio parahaemolyticus]|nr:restriction endonuclease subunit S [Vibrio parahaemolyticus]EGQ9478651.1 restriction endonuclease subunit S [Vibrio parahaemolyticus]EJG0186622.1 restriction endonuclease subunit S [Vibrio parahaemolyticus]EJG0191410.1 restriction endonuclease subunit S [Vibrio parahaemolyticus]EJS4016865.1 restriction endonuclease subunit S [Vibrio parahaemolyticus]